MVGLDMARMRRGEYIKGLPQIDYKGEPVKDS
jgi:hypothetical protein